MSDARHLDRTIALGLLGAGGLAGIVLAAQAWWHLTGQDLDQAASAGAGIQTTISGTTATSGLAQVLPICVLAAALLALVLRYRGRRIVGGLGALLGAGMAVLGGWHPRPSPVEVQTALRQVTLADDAVLRVDIWVWGYLAAGLLVVAGAVTMALRAHTWPSRAAKYESTALHSAADAAASPDNPDTWWKAMDAGVDPTAVGGAAGGPPDDPVSPGMPTSATMAPKDAADQARTHE